MEDSKLQELYDTFFKLALQEITQGANPSAVAGVMVAIASRMYRTTLGSWRRRWLSLQILIEIKKSAFSRLKKVNALSNYKFFIKFFFHEPS